MNSKYIRFILFISFFLKLNICNIKCSVITEITIKNLDTQLKEIEENCKQQNKKFNEIRKDIKNNEGGFFNSSKTTLKYFPHYKTYIKIIPTKKNTSIT